MNYSRTTTKGSQKTGRQGSDVVHLELKDKIVIIDRDDFERVSELSWGVYGSKKTREFYVRGTTDKFRGWLHRFIVNAQPGEIVDHINGNPLDNRKCNLRICTTAQNNMAQHNLRKKKTSKFKGVCWDKLKGKWRCEIRVNKKKIHLGLFNSEEEAGKYYDKKAIEFFGEFAVTNEQIRKFRGSLRPD